MSLAACATAVVAAVPPTIVTTPVGPLPLGVVLLAIAGAETGGTWDLWAVGDCGLGGPACGRCADGQSGGTSWGPWQIHNVHAAYLTQASGTAAPRGWRTWLADPAHSVQAALYVWREQGLTAWTTYQTGAWRAYLPPAVAALAARGVVLRPAPPPPAAGAMLGWGLLTVAGVAGLTAAGAALAPALRPILARAGVH